MPRNNNPIVNLNTWKHRDMQNIVDEPKGRRRHVIATRLGWTTNQEKRVDYHRARVVMQYLHSQWSGVEYMELVDNGNHQGVYERIYNWCVHELQPVPPLEVSAQPVYGCACAHTGADAAPSATARTARSSKIQPWCIYCSSLQQEKKTTTVKECRAGIYTK